MIDAKVEALVHPASVVVVVVGATVVVVTAVVVVVGASVVVVGSVVVVLLEVVDDVVVVVGSVVMDVVVLEVVEDVDVVVGSVVVVLLEVVEDVVVVDVSVVTGRRLDAVSSSAFRSAVSAEIVAWTSAPPDAAAATCAGRVTMPESPGRMTPSANWRMPPGNVASAAVPPAGGVGSPGVRPSPKPTVSAAFSAGSAPAFQ